MASSQLAQGLMALQTTMQHVGQGLNTWLHDRKRSWDQVGQRVQAWGAGVGDGLAAQQRHLNSQLHNVQSLFTQLNPHPPGRQSHNASFTTSHSPTRSQPLKDTPTCLDTCHSNSTSDLSIQQRQQLGLALASLSSSTLSGPVSGLGQGSSHPWDSAAQRRAELGKATWTFLHILAAQYPEHPTRQQKRDVKQLIDLLTRVYPCGSCASHFSKIVRNHPPTVNSGRELQDWTCKVHNIVNRSIGKPEFNCDVVAGRWAPLDCADDNEDTGGTGVSGCDMTVGPRRW